MRSALFMAVSAIVAPSQSWSEELSKVAQTSRRVAGLRALESERDDAVHRDVFAAHLAGEREMDEIRAMMRKYPGDVRHSPLAVRARAVEEEVLAAVARSKADGVSTIQVVNLGAGMDTRPWRLDGLESVMWFEVDVNEVLQLKSSLMTTYSSGGSGSRSSTDGSASGDGSRAASANSTPPLKVAANTAVPLDLRDAEHALLPDLTATGLNPALPTVWVAEGVLYYMPVDAVESLLRVIGSWRHNSGAASEHEHEKQTPAKQLVVATVINEDAWKHAMKRAVMQCCLEELEEKDIFRRAGWEHRGSGPRSLVTLARDRYGVEVMLPVDPKSSNANPAEFLVVLGQPEAGHPGGDGSGAGRKLSGEL